MIPTFFLVQLLSSKAYLYPLFDKYCAHTEQKYTRQCTETSKCGMAQNQMSIPKTSYVILVNLLDE